MFWLSDFLTLKCKLEINLTESQLGSSIVKQSFQLKLTWLKPFGFKFFSRSFEQIFCRHHKFENNKSLKFWEFSSSIERLKHNAILLSAKEILQWLKLQIQIWIRTNQSAASYAVIFFSVLVNFESLPLFIENDAELSNIGLLKIDIQHLWKLPHSKIANFEKVSSLHFKISIWNFIIFLKAFY
jgi:hypothetical protein